MMYLSFLGTLHRSTSNPQKESLRSRNFAKEGTRLNKSLLPIFGKLTSPEITAEWSPYKYKFPWFQTIVSKPKRLLGRMIRHAVYEGRAQTDPTYTDVIQL
ncbi:MAG: hypothetical protein QXX41_01510 [Nitrososphaerota archaeon]